MGGTGTYSNSIGFGDGVPVSKSIMALVYKVSVNKYVTALGLCLCWELLKSKQNIYFLTH